MQNPRVRTRNHLNKAIRRQKPQRKKRDNSDAARLSRFIRRELTTRIPQLLSEHRLTLAMFAFYLIILFGIEAIFSGVFRDLVRTDAFYHSLSQLGFILLDDILNQGDAFPDLGPLPAPNAIPHIVFPP